MSSYTIIFIYFQKDVFQKTDFKNINILKFIIKIYNITAWKGSDSDPNMSKFLDPDPNKMYLDSKHCFEYTHSPVLVYTANKRNSTPM